MVWEDLARVGSQDEIMQCLKNKQHRNLIVPLTKFRVERNSKMDTTLGNIKGFLDYQIKELDIENRVLTISLSESKRPVKYFWGVHDFVQGLRGALLGHEYLTRLGILHCDISENNIVLGLRPGHERGYLIDLDMAVLQPAEELTQAGPPKPRALFDPSRRSTQKAPALPQLDSKKPVKALRSRTFPYMSYNVLRGGRHTHFDDVESFLYVLLLFFFSYAGPLPVLELRKADEAGFVQSVGSGHLSHMRNWPDEYADWADGKAQKIGKEKHSTISSEDGATILVESAEFVDCLRNNWSEELHVPICELVENSITIFYNSTLRTGSKGSRTEVSHAEFISMLDTWLGMYADLEDEFSNCPFKQES
ncbi:hypothetical protein OG21DRAFT_209470 [Imleria badia]|nr:hypothetical protein OG21DRAFT_209470 [Imleria badia]